MALFRGSRHNIPPMIVDMVRLWGLRIPLAYFLGNQFGSTGIWWGMALSNACHHDLLVLKSLQIKGFI